MKLPAFGQIDERDFIHLIGLDLSDSWLLDWTLDNNLNALTVDLEFSVWPESPFYEKPKPGDWTCYKQGQLIFSNIISITGYRNLNEIQPSIDANQSKDWGNIYSLRLENGKVQFDTDFTSISLICEQLEVII